MREYFECFVQHNQQFKDPFDRLIQCITSGNNKVASSLASQTLLIDDSWLEIVESAVLSIEKITHNPRTFIKVDREILSAEKVRRIDNESVRYLSRHTSDINDIDENDNVYPKRLNVAVSDMDYAIYENRVVYALILRIDSFLKRAKVEVEERINTIDTTSLNISSKYVVDEKDFDCNINIKMTADSKDIKNVEKNQDVLRRIRALLKQIRSIRRTQFCSVLAGYKRVVPPISRTNLFKLNFDYKKCLECWSFLSANSAIDCKLSVETAPITLYNRYYYDIGYLIMAATLTFAYNTKSENEELLNLSKRTRQPRRFKIVRNVEHDPIFPHAPDVSDADLVNQYYYEKMLDVLNACKEKLDLQDISQKQKLSINFNSLFYKVRRVNLALFEEALEIDKTNTKIEGTLLVRKADKARRLENDIEKYQVMINAYKRDLGLELRKQETRKRNLDKLREEMGIIEAKNKQLMQEKAKLQSLKQAEKEKIALAREQAKTRAREEKEAIKKAEATLKKQIKDEETERRISRLSDKQLLARENAQRVKLAREQAEREEQERLAREQAEREAQERLARELAEREEQERLARELAEREAQERLAIEQAQREEQERLAREQAEREAQERLAREQAEREAQERLAIELAQQERLVREQAEREEQERLARELAQREEQKRLARELAQREEQERLAIEQAQREAQERLAIELAQQERLVREQAEREEQERLAIEQAQREEQKRLARELAQREEQERIAIERIHEEEERLAQEQARIIEIKDRQNVIAQIKAELSDNNYFGEYDDEYRRLYAEMTAKIRTAEKRKETIAKLKAKQLREQRKDK
ncbi:MAG: hypothetical protein PHW00_00965 [Clostridia bacterium]|nr:hypothetical protein [Clostridia bacterium]